MYLGKNFPCSAKMEEPAPTADICSHTGNHNLWCHGGYLQKTMFFKYYIIE